MSLPGGSIVVLHLGTPREQVFGVLLSLGPSGVLVRGLHVASVDDWIRQVAAPDAEGSDLGWLGLTQTFYPMHRVEKIVLDEPSHGLQAIHETFELRTGRSLRAWVQDRHGDHWQGGG